MNSTIQFTCPHCTHTVQLDSSTVGQQGNCPSCGQTVTIAASVPEFPTFDSVLPTHADPSIVQSPPQLPVVLETPQVNITGDVRNPMDVADTEMTPVRVSTGNHDLTRKDVNWKSHIPLTLASIAIALSIFTLSVTLFDNPLGKGAGAFDFSTPENALMSQLNIRAEQDIRAQLDLEHMMRGDVLREKRNTIKVHQTSVYQGKKLLFISFAENGLIEYSVVGFEKHVDTGLWFGASFSTYDMDDSKLKAAIEKWKAKNDDEVPVVSGIPVEADSTPTEMDELPAEEAEPTPA